jgi:molybdopterin/thiamine biosynthesis adenylyltransferase
MPIPATLSFLIQQSSSDDNWKPVILNPELSDDIAAIEQLLVQPGLRVYDRLREQLVDLIKTTNPHVSYDAKTIENQIDIHTSGVENLFYYGRWVYYPWSNKMVHLLPEDEFVYVRSSRNTYKITPDEKAILSTKKIGVIGLSVGQSVSLTMAMERICNEIRIADFDRLELTNLNRIRTGVHNLGQFKTHVVAREIAEIDPYLKVVCFDQGLNEDNLHSFFTDGGTLDLVIEESDGFDIKVLSRLKARELKVPVIMEASDKCMVDVERFDREPHRELLHGIMKDMDVVTLKSLQTNEDKIPYMLDILGIDTCSTRLKSSMLEIDQTVNTWPQLASAVVMGGGIAADVARRVLLNQFTASGRYYVDVEDIISNHSPSAIPYPHQEDMSLSKNKDQHEHEPIASDSPSFPMPKAPLSLSEIPILKEIQLQDTPPPSHDISQSLFEDLVALAAHTPSAGNSQPWRWKLYQGRIFLFYEKKASYSWADANEMAAYLGLGCSIETMIQAGIRLEVNLHFQPLLKSKSDYLIGFFEITDQPQSALSFNGQPFHKGIEIRVSNRKFYQHDVDIPFSFMSQVNQQLLSPPHAFHLLQKKEEIEAVAEALGGSERLRFMDPRGHKELYDKELKWSEDPNHIREGLDVRTLELDALDTAGLVVSKDPNVMANLRNWNVGNAFKKLTGKRIRNTSCIGMITSEENHIHAWLESGRAIQRVWIACNMTGYSMHPVSAPFFFINRIEDDHHFFTPSQLEEMDRIKTALYQAVPLLQERKGTFMFRLGKADTVEFRSLKLPVSHLIIH